MKPEVRLAVLVTHGITARYLLRGQLAYLRQQGFTVTLVASPGPDLDHAAEREGVAAVAVPMHREISPWSDLVSLVRLLRTLRRLNPQIVCAGTPKAGLLGMLAARLAAVPVRLYTLRGLRLETTSGWRRSVLELAERWASRCAHRVLCVSESLRGRYVSLGLAPASKTTVLGAGSSNGVDVDRFHPAEPGAAAPATAPPEPAWRELADARRHGVPVVGFVGRLTRDKGIGDLMTAFFDIVRPRHPRARLLVLGELEDGDPPPSGIRTRLADAAVWHPGFVQDSAPWYQAMDVLAFPSRREGFPNAPLEAAASGVPVVGYEVTGTIDAVEDGVTGRLVPPGDVAALGQAVVGYLGDEALRRGHAAAARRRAVERFARERVWRTWSDEYWRHVGDRSPH